MGLLGGYGLQVIEVEFLTGWTSGDELHADTLTQFLQLLELAATVGASRINVGGDPPGEAAELGERFGELCDAAAPFGVMVALEPMPYTNVPDARSAARIVAEASRPNGGLLLDTWHQHRAGGLATLAEVPPNLIAGIHLADAQPNPGHDLRREGEHQRLLPGAGVADLVGFLRRLWWLGIGPSIAVEVISDDLQRMPAARAAKLAADAARSVLASAKIDIDQLGSVADPTPALHTC